jgi:hypothetical protein
MSAFLNLITALALAFSVQSDMVSFQMINNSGDPIQLDIPGFRSMTLAPAQTSQVRFHNGQEVFLVKDVNHDYRDERVLLFVVGQEHVDQIIKVDKVARKAARQYMTQR